MAQAGIHSPLLSDAAGQQQIQTDVLVIGGGPAGTWAAVAAAARGARVTLVEKGFCGTSGATAPSGTGLWHVPRDRAAREHAKASRFTMGGELAEHAWMDQVLEQTWINTETLTEWGYPFPTDEHGQLQRTSLQGPEYMRLMRKKVKEAGARILDHSPALELLTDENGEVAGATGITRSTGETWVVRAGAVVITTGGCAFLSRALGCNVLTGDGYLMAAEVGAELSGMEFSNAYGLGPSFSSVTKSLFYNWATFYDADGVPIDGAGSSRGRGIIARTLQTQPVFACLDRADADIRAWMRNAQPNFFVSFDRQGIDPFSEHFPVALRLEGTVRGTGGLHVIGGDCATSVPGLYAAGDAATRELICGAFTGGGSHNAAWAMSSGFWAGAGAAEFSRGTRSLARRTLRRAGTAGIQDGGASAWNPDELVRAVQAEVFPYDRNWTRRADLLEDSLQRLDAQWARVRQAGAPSAQHAVRAREAVAMLATARWMYRSALQRTETRGMARRADHAGLDLAQQHRLVSGGLDEIWVRTQAVRNTPVPAAASAHTQPERLAA
ncbi:FAD-dependent oxidoreductase [Hydrogenophaga palleronii]|uniref:FAD-dependent oxidoreductase n=1 Tax=Hydrogenophaga palleronii TaxID=65655 RepID=UPI0008243D56|nr:FAD-binding protein [Hydrogenophaga palleronii]